jgi:NTE family protein
MRFGSRDKTAATEGGTMKKALILAGGGARGAFHIGVWKYLQESKWTPDLICGTSVGAINAAAIGAGMSAEHLNQLWTTYNRPKIYRLMMLKFLASVLLRKPLRPITDTGPMRRMISKNLDFSKLRQSPIEIVISAVNLLNGRLYLFNQQEIDIDHLMASSAMPIIFPWQYINGQPFWDGGVIANAPLFAALQKQMDEIIVVLLSPVGHVDLPFPATLMNGLEVVFEHLLSGSYQVTQPIRHGDRGHIDRPYPYWPARVNQDKPAGPPPTIRVVAPSRMLGFRSLLNFSNRQARQLIQEGYRNARRHLGPLG